MLLSLEALRAKHGDSLILYFGEAGKPRVIVIDGGPVGVFKDALLPRLEELAAKIGDGDPPDRKLAIEMLMVSHIDDDHINGVLELSNFLKEEQKNAQPFEVSTLWLNAFDDLIGNDAEELAKGLKGAPAHVAQAGGPAAGWTGKAQAVVASVGQGRDLRSNADGLGWKPNAGFDGFVTAPVSGGSTVPFGELTLTVICPLLPQLEALQKEWSKKLKAMEIAQPAEVASIAESIDSSVYNLSSIVCLAELGGKRMLLTGDALGANILEGLRAADLLDAEGKIEVDVLKLPHHGSDRNTQPPFFETVKADHYVVSGDGQYHNPEPETFRRISKSRVGADGRPEDDFTLHLTYEHCSNGVGEELADFFASERAAGRTYGVEFRPDADLGLRIDLLDAVDY
jgi:glyoxylase-like metal-dependent hydrolase (beta-lactamase superfamily II)